MSMGTERPWPWKLAGLVLVVGFGLLAFSWVNDSWLGDVASGAFFLVWIGWAIFLRRQGYWGGTRDANVTHNGH